MKREYTFLLTDSFETIENALNQISLYNTDINNLENQIKELTEHYKKFAHFSISDQNDFSLVMKTEYDSPDNHKVVSEKITEILMLREKLKAKKHSRALQAGMILQVSRQNLIFIHRKKDYIPKDGFKEIITGYTVVDFIWYGRNQSTHFEDNEYDESVLKFFGKLKEFYSHIDLQIPGVNYSYELLEIIGWKNAYEVSQTLEKLISRVNTVNYVKCCLAEIGMNGYRKRENNLTTSSAFQSFFKTDSKSNSHLFNDFIKWLKSEDNVSERNKKVKEMVAEKTNTFPIAHCNTIATSVAEYFRSVLDDVVSENKKSHHYHDSKIESQMVHVVYVEKRWRDSLSSYWSYWGVDRNGVVFQWYTNKDQSLKIKDRLFVSGTLEFRKYKTKKGVLIPFNKINDIAYRKV